MISVNRARLGPTIVALMATIVFVTSCGINADNPPKFETTTMQAYVEHYIDSNYLRSAGGTQDND